MSEPILLVTGSTLILLGILGLIAAAIMLSRQRHQPQPATSSGMPAEHEEADESPATAPTDEDFEMVVIREHETNPDGSSRQEIIKTLQIGDPVDLLPESPRPEGRNEIKVVAPGGTIGYVPSARVPQLLDMLSQGTTIHSEVSHIIQLEDQRGIWINVSVWR